MNEIIKEIRLFELAHRELAMWYLSGFRNKSSSDCPLCQLINHTCHEPQCNKCTQGKKSIDITFDIAPCSVHLTYVAGISLAYETLSDKFNFKLWQKPKQKGQKMRARYHALVADYIHIVEGRFLNMYGFIVHMQKITKKIDEFVYLSKK